MEENGSRRDRWILREKDSDEREIEWYSLPKPFLDDYQENPSLHAVRLVLLHLFSIPIPNLV